MALISIPNVFTVGATIVASQHNSNFSVIYSEFNGNITTANIASNAAIVDTQLTQISTAGKVSGAALTSLSSTPSGAGLLPVANIDSGSTANKIVALDSSAKLPAVDGSALTNLTATVSSIKDYGTSASSSTAKTQANLKIAYGQVTLSTGAAQITNLSFTSSSTYQVTLARVNSSDVSQSVQVKSYDSGAAFTIRDSLNGSAVVSWLAIGT